MAFTAINIYNTVVRVRSVFCILVCLCYAKVTPKIIETLYFYYIDFYVTVVGDPKNYGLFFCLTLKTSLQ